jgi:prohibitin 1
MEIEVKSILGAVLGVLLIAVFSMSCNPVSSGNRGVVSHWGKVQATTLDEGMHFTMPFATKVHEYSIRTSKDDVQASAATKDMQELGSEIAVNWHPDPTQLAVIFEKFGQREDVLLNIITPAVNEVFKAAAATLSAEDILKKREQLKAIVDDGLKARLSPYGVQIDDISLVNLKFSDDFNKAIEAKQVAEQEAQEAAYDAQKAQQEAIASVNRAKGEAEAQQLQKNTITPELIKLKSLEVQRAAVDKWNGVLPSVSGGNTPFISIAAPGDK